jgi:hypothetical protein
MSDTPSPLIPRDAFSTELRRLRGNVAALSSSSTIHSQDVYGNAETWVLETFRDAEGAETIFLQRNDATGGARQVLPPQVTAAIARQRDHLSTRARRRQGHNLIALRRQRGDTLGNPDALRKARRARKAGTK